MCVCWRCKRPAHVVHSYTCCANLAQHLRSHVAAPLLTSRDFLLVSPIEEACHCEVQPGHYVVFSAVPEYSRSSMRIQPEGLNSPPSWKTNPGNSHETSQGFVTRLPSRAENCARLHVEGDVVIFDRSIVSLRLDRRRNVVSNSLIHWSKPWY